MSDGEGMYFWQLCACGDTVSSQSSPASYSMHNIGNFEVYKYATGSLG